MTEALYRLTTALADRYRIERELGAGWPVVAEATARLVSLKRRGILAEPNTPARDGPCREGLALWARPDTRGVQRQPNPGLEISP
ncbi:MAG: hypothetical protein ABJD11_17855 [Gemmatimonadota bacterium]